MNKVIPQNCTVISYEVRCGVFFGAGFSGLFNCFTWKTKHIRDAKKIKCALEKYGYRYVCKQFDDFEQSVGMPCDMKVNVPVISKIKTVKKYGIKCNESRKISINE